MTRGIRVIMRKELLEAIGSAAAEKSSRFIALLIPLLVVLFAVSAYMSDPRLWAWGTMVFMPALASFMAVFYAAESLSGERERHTLETLLSAPVSENSILLGKAAAHLVMTLGFALVALILSWVAVLPFAGPGDPRAPPAGALLLSVLLTLHVFLFSETVGIFVGQRADTVAGGNAMIMPIFILPAIFIGFAPTLAETFIESGNLDSIATIVTRMVITTIFVVYAALALLIPLVLRKNQARRLLGS